LFLWFILSLTLTTISSLLSSLLILLKFPTYSFRSIFISTFYTQSTVSTLIIPIIKMISSGNSHSLLMVLLIFTSLLIFSRSSNLLRKAIFSSIKIILWKINSKKHRRKMNFSLFLIKWFMKLIHILVWLLLTCY
jgi:hypothetical protein